MSKLASLPIEGEVLPPLPSLEAEVTECHRFIDEVRSISGRINRTNNQVRKLNEKVEDLCLLLGFKLLGIKKRVEAGEGCGNWWEFFSRSFPKVPRPHAERWLKIAASQQPEQAALEYRNRDAEYQRKHRERKRHLTRPCQTAPGGRPHHSVTERR